MIAASIQPECFRTCFSLSFLIFRPSKPSHNCQQFNKHVPSPVIFYGKFRICQLSNRCPSDTDSDSQALIPGCYAEAFRIFHGVVQLISLTLGYQHGVDANFCCLRSNLKFYSMEGCSAVKSTKLLSSFSKKIATLQPYGDCQLNMHS